MMLGVFKKRWRPKRSTHARSQSPSPEDATSPEPPDKLAAKSPASRQIHPLTDEKSQMVAYGTASRRRAKPPKNLQLSEDANLPLMNHLANTNLPLTPIYPLTPNICVEDGRIEFVKPPLDAVRNSFATPPASPIFAARVPPQQLFGIREACILDDAGTEKKDGDKELLEIRIRHLEENLEKEKKNSQRERLNVAKLQNKLAKRESQARCDVDRERRARSDCEARVRGAEADAARATAKLHAAHREISRMEDTIRTLMQYKTRSEILKQEKASLSAALEARSVHYQNTLAQLSSDNDTLRSQLLTLSRLGVGLGEELPTKTESSHQEGTDQYERCLDNVAHHVVKALLSQKGLREELGCMRSRVHELEAQNRALTTLLVRQLKPQVRPSPATPSPPESTTRSDLTLHPYQHEGQVYLLNGCDTTATVTSSPSDLPTPPTERISSEIAENKFISLHTKKNHLTNAEYLRKNKLFWSNDDIRHINCGPAKILKCDNKKRFSTSTLDENLSDFRNGDTESLVSFNDSSCSELISISTTATTNKLSADDKRRHQILTELWSELKGIEVTPQSLIKALSAVDPSLWVPPERPLTLNLKLPAPIMLSKNTPQKPSIDQVPSKQDEDAVVETPESGNKDEGYSTMSSDVQADSSRQSEPNRELEDVKEASDETDNQTIVSVNNIDNGIIVLDSTNPDNVVYIPVNLALSLSTRNSFPPSKNLLPFQHIIRSFSDSHLCLKLTTGSTPCGENCFSITSPLSSTPSMFILDIKPIINHDLNNLRRSKATSSLVAQLNVIEQTINKSNRQSWISNIDEQVEGPQFDAEYVQHWLKLDDTRSALQQQHRDLLELEYDQAELEDWSLSLSCEDLQDGNWKRHSPLSDVMTPGQISLSTLPSIQENNILELEEDVSDCLWNNSTYMTDKLNSSADIENNEAKETEKQWHYNLENSEMVSPSGSWCSGEGEDCLNNDCFYSADANDENALSKRSSAALSGCSDEAECPAVGTDFTRDFYRLVKYESTKSLASNSSRGVGGGPPEASNILRIHDMQSNNHDREHALQNVLNFIAEQEKYCHSREELDSLPSRPTSEIRELPPPCIETFQLPFIQSDDSNVEDDRYIRENYNNSYGNEITLSESESCDIILAHPQISPHFNDVSPDLKKLPRIIDSQGDDVYSASQQYSKFSFQDTENYVDEEHLLKVHQKNKINRSIDSNMLPKKSVLTPASAENIHKEGGIDRGKKQIVEKTYEYKYSCESSSNKVSSTMNGQPSDTVKDIGNLCPTVQNQSDPDFSLLDEVLNVCCRNSAALLPVPEEEELTDTNSKMSESNTTSSSTVETIISNAELKRKSTDKSRIPMPLSQSSKKSSKNKSRIPVLDVAKSQYGTSLITSENPIHLHSSLPSNIIVSQGPAHARVVSFHEAATSKDVIDELTRMIRQESDVPCDIENTSGMNKRMNSDNSCWAPSGWIHVEKDIDFNDPKARANLLDVMLASSDSSPSSTSSCAGSFSSDSGDEPADYTKLHRLHRYRRQKKAAALRNRGMAVLRFSCYRRPSIIGRDDFFVRYGRQEQEAVASFDFLEEISTSESLISSAEDSKLKTILENQVSQDSGKVSQKSLDLKGVQGASPKSEDSTGRVTFSDSCAASCTGSDVSFDDHSP